MKAGRWRDFFLFGLIWVFVFSIPLGKGKRIFDVVHHLLVNNIPVHWTLAQIQYGFQATLEATEQSGIVSSGERYPEFK